MLTIPRRISLLLALTCSLWVTPLFADDAAPRLRFNDRIVRKAMSRGAASSPTFRRLLHRLAASNLVIYIERRASAGRPSGFTQFVTAAAGRRYLLIAVEGRRADDALVGLLGHELQHAVEVAESPWVTDQETYGWLYHAIGRPSCGPPRWCFDTDAALDAGYRVIEELARDERPPIAE